MEAFRSKGLGTTVAPNIVRRRAQTTKSKLDRFVRTVSPRIVSMAFLLSYLSSYTIDTALACLSARGKVALGHPRRLFRLEDKTDPASFD